MSRKTRIHSANGYLYPSTHKNLSPRHRYATVLVTGGHGFLVSPLSSYRLLPDLEKQGAHVAKRLYNDGTYFVIIIDVSPTAPIEGPICHEFIQGNLCDIATCIVAVRGVEWVLHFAANMGGMGTIHGDNGATMYGQNHTMTQNLLSAISLPNSSVTCFFYASSACVYPEALQTDGDVSLRETIVFDGGRIPEPQGLYGLEKLNSELLIAQFKKRLDIRIARFHNIYGPGGSWNNGREKAPAAFLRKARACRVIGEKYSATPTFEVWGDGTQCRSFLYIDDAVDAILKLLLSSCSTPINIGSDQAVSIQQLAELALRVAGARARFTYDGSKPVGVGSRNSNNELSRSDLSWTPKVSLEEGMSLTFEWIKAQADTYLAPNEQDSTRLRQSLRTLLLSKVVNLDAERLTFAVLLPVTSRGSSDPNDCLTNLRDFIQSNRSKTQPGATPILHRINLSDISYTLPLTRMITSSATTTKHIGRFLTLVSHQLRFTYMSTMFTPEAIFVGSGATVHVKPIRMAVTILFLWGTM